MTEKKKIRFDKIEFSVYPDASGEKRWFIMDADMDTSLAKLLTKPQLLQLAYLIIDAAGNEVSGGRFGVFDDGHTTTIKPTKSVVELDGYKWGLELRPRDAEVMAAALISCAAYSRRLAKEGEKSEARQEVEALAKKIGVDEMKKILEEGSTK